MHAAQRLVAAGGTVAALALVCGIVASPARAQNSSVVTEDGVRYQVSTRTVDRMVPVTTMQDRHQTVYTQQLTTENLTHQQLYSVPVTQYQMVSRLRGRWNPFITPYWTHEARPVTTWHQQVATVQVPVSRVSWVPQTTTYQVPTVTYRPGKVEETTKVALDDTRTYASAQPLPGGARTATIAARTTTSTPLGGVALENDPPREATGWQTPALGSRY